jgi:hypothetical protein
VSHDGIRSCYTSPACVADRLDLHQHHACESETRALYSVHHSSRSRKRACLENFPCVCSRPVRCAESCYTSNIQYFKGLPADFSKRWAIYLLVLEKDNCWPKVYIGSGTNGTEGVSSRIGQYRRLELLPRYLGKALDEGHTIVHKGLLCWCSIPNAALQPMFRLLFLILEAAFSYMFWAMKAVTKDYGMVHICLWDRNTLEYDGLRSHYYLQGVSGDFKLSAKEIEALAA